MEKELWKHVKTCKSRPEDKDHKEKCVKARARLFLEDATFTMKMLTGPLKQPKLGQADKDEILSLSD